MKIRLSRLIYIFLSAVLMLWNCDDSTSSDNPVPGRVILVAKSAEDDSVETGIDAEYDVRAAGKNGIFLQWYEVDDNDLAAYRIYRSAVDTSTAFMLVAQVGKSMGKIDTFYIDSSVEVGIRYYYRVSAMDEEGQEGPRSRAAHYKLWEMCTLDAPPPFDSTFQWRWPSNDQPHRFVFRLRRQITLTYVLVRTFVSTYSPTQQWSLTDLGLDALEPGQYEWRIDIIGTEPNHGSETDWLSFVVQ